MFKGKFPYFSSSEHGIFSINVDCNNASKCENIRCLYKQKTLGVHIWYMGEGASEERDEQLLLRKRLGPWYQPELYAISGTNCHNVWCRDYIPLNEE